MPGLSKLAISGVRNIQAAELQPSPGINLIYGDNGSGKTSLLEAIYLLSHGRSFRTHQQKPLISESLQQAVVHATTDQGLSLGIQRTAKGQAQLRVGGNKASGVAELTRQLPVLLLNTDAFRILEGGPKERRQFLDWGVFHVEHLFLEHWRNARRALVNRNALLKDNAANQHIDPWTHEFALHAGHLHDFRARYIEALSGELRSLWDDGMATTLGGELGLSYDRGWHEQQDLAEQLNSSLQRDRRYGHTMAGPHRADLGFFINGKACAEHLSRGQIKTLICALKVAQARLLEKEQQRASIFLADDLTAELDATNLARVLGLLRNGSGSQLFVTAIEVPGSFAKGAYSDPNQTKLFHVKHGKITNN